MNRLTKQVFAGALALLMGAPAFAGHNSYNLQGAGGWYFGQRNYVQRQRIKEGWQSGALSGSEALGLVGDQVRVNRLRWQYMGDGYLSGDEAASLHRAYNDASGQIYREKSDGEYWAGGGYHGPHGHPHY